MKIINLGDAAISPYGTLLAFHRINPETEQLGQLICAVDALSIVSIGVDLERNDGTVQIICDTVIYTSTGCEWRDAIGQWQQALANHYTELNARYA